MDFIVSSYSALCRISIVIQLPQLDNALCPVSQQIGVDYTILKYAFCLIISCPLGVLLRSIQSIPTKHFMSAFVGIIMMQWVFKESWFHSLFSSTVTYLILSTSFLPSTVKPHVNMIWVMAFLLMCHAHQMIYSYLSTSFDFRNTQMVLTIKLTSIGWNLYDYYSVSLTEASEDTPIDSKRKQVLKSLAIPKPPNLLEYFGYIYCFPCMMVGPALSYKDYISSINGEVYISSRSSRTSTIPSSLYPALSNLLAGLTFLGIHLYFSSKFRVMQLLDEDFISTTSLWYRLLYLYITMISIRCRFYFAWKVSQAAATFAGFGFQGFDSNGTPLGWDGACNVDMIATETATSMTGVSKAWNKGTQRWLELYVYTRSGDNLVLTYLFSALWHGFYPGFLLFFLTAAVVTAASRKITRILRPLVYGDLSVGSEKGVGDSITKSFTTSAKKDRFVAYLMDFTFWQSSRIVTGLILTLTSPFFMMQSWDRAWQLMKSFHFLPHTILYASCVVLILLPSPPSKKKQSLVTLHKKL